MREGSEFEHAVGQDLHPAYQACGARVESQGKRDHHDELVGVLAEQRAERVEEPKDVERIAGMWGVEYRGEDGRDDESVNAAWWGRA